MRRSRIFCLGPLAADQLVELDARNSHYLLHVLRIKTGQPLVLFDGSGCDYHGTVEQVLRKSIQVRIIDQCEHQINESRLHTTLGIAISKGDRMDWVMQKATELGVSEIQPLITQRVDVKLNQQRMEKKHLHWHGIVIGACEQSGRSVIPKLKPACSVDHWLDSHHSDLKLVLRANGEPFEPMAKAVNHLPTSAAVLIGPEGGLTDTELQLAEKANFVATGFGPRILRTETAPIIALTLLQSQWGDF